jgi:predicted metal-dependent peptidase
MMNEEIRGLMPAGFMSQVQRINAPPVISWQALLKKYVGTISAEKRRTRTRLNRRQPDRFDLSGAIDEKILKIVVAVDTSGSMDDAQIQAVFREIFAILAKRKYEVTIIECDAKVQRVYKVSKPANIALSVKGRGGTAFTPVVEYINNDRYFRDALLIYFTDGYGENAIPRPRTYRNLWVILGNTAHLSLREPYGTKVAMQQAQRR